MSGREDWKNELGHLAIDMGFDRPLAAFSTLGIGGPAAAFARPDTVGQLRSLLDICRRHGFPWLVVGGGANILFSDEGLEGLVIKLGRDFEDIRDIGSNRVYAGAAVSNARALDFALGKSLAGLECLSGVPGSLGGSAMMNAGAGGKDLGSLIQIVSHMSPEGQLVETPKDRLEFSYRSLKGLPEGAVITGLVLQLKDDEFEKIDGRIEEILKHRRQSQPRGLKSAGCFFRNPKGDSAGRLIDDCGLKGAAVGGARVSEVHANFLVNQGGATAADMRELIGLVKGEVKRKHGFELELEIQVLDREGRRCAI